MTDNAGKTKSSVNRRQALARLGLGAEIAYAAPTILHRVRRANAASCSQNKGKGNPWCDTSGKAKSKGKG